MKKMSNNFDFTIFSKCLYRIRIFNEICRLISETFKFCELNEIIPCKKVFIEEKKSESYKNLAFIRNV